MKILYLLPLMLGLLVLMSGCLFQQSKQLEYDMLIAAEDECEMELSTLEQDKNVIKHRRSNNETKANAAAADNDSSGLQPAKVPNK
jgi:hypothetical protein